MRPADSTTNRAELGSILPTIPLLPLIDGEFVTPRSGDTRLVNDPFTNQALVEMFDCGAPEIALAVGAARKAFDDGRWSGLAASERAKTLRRLADLIERDHRSLALIESAGTGKLLSGTLGWDIDNAATMFRYYADLILGLEETRSIPGSSRAYERREPIGVVAAIAPWNFPFACIAWKIAPALAVGCTVVVKPPELAPLSAQALARLVLEAGFPAGVVNIVMGDGASAGAALVADPRIDAISFTGGAETARTIVAGSGGRLPRHTLELGGKGANVVLADADLDLAVPGTVEGMFGLAGQNCCASSRTIVAREIADTFSERLVAAAEERILGDHLDGRTEQGPQINARHVDRIGAFVRDALEGGARLLTGGPGARAELGENFYPPTILGGVDRQARVWREEVFGPVGCIEVVDGLEQAIEAANDTYYGLSAAVWTRDATAAERVVRSVRVGTCWVNGYGFFDPEVPWGGTRGSGYGCELGEAAIDEFLNRKSVYWQR